MIGRVVAIHRNKLGISQEDFAERVGLSRGTIAQLETGQIKWPRPETLIKMAEVLQVPMTQLLREAGIIPETEGVNEEIAEFARLNPQFAAVAEALMADPDLLKRVHGFVEMYRGKG